VGCFLCGPCLGARVWRSCLQTGPRLVAAALSTAEWSELSPTAVEVQDRRPTYHINRICNCSSYRTVNTIPIKCEVHPRTGREGPEGRYRRSSTFSLTSALDGVGGQRHAPAALPPWTTLGTQCLRPNDNYRTSMQLSEVIAVCGTASCGASHE
jgi:hypothetical protein